MPWAHVIALVLWSGCGGDSSSDQRVDIGGGALDGGRTRADASTREIDGAVPDARTASTMTTPADSADTTPRCGAAVCACADGFDNDADGRIDLADPDCTSAFANDEQPYSGIWGDHRADACQGCFFSGNSGTGEDGCRVPYSCLTSGSAGAATGSCASCGASGKCLAYCLDYVPNGCDCFGCCTVTVSPGVSQDVLLDSTCNVDGDISSGCTPCVRSASCENPCGRCELCPGKTVAQLPPDCVSPAPDGDADAGASAELTDAVVPNCDDGAQRCGADLPGCGLQHMCLYGCCIKMPE